MGISRRSPAAADGSRALARSWARLAGLAGVVAALGGAGSAQAAPWGYEQVTPADSASTDIFGLGVSADMSTAWVSTLGMPIEGMPADGRAGVYIYAAPRSGSLWTLGPVDVSIGMSITQKLRISAADGSSAIAYGAWPTLSGGGGNYVLHPDGTGDLLDAGTGLGLSKALLATADLGRVAFRADGSNQRVYLSTGDGPPSIVSVDNDGNTMTTIGLGGGTLGNNQGPITNALSESGDSVFFTSTVALDGDSDGTAADIYRRVLTPGAEETILVSDTTPGAGVDASHVAEYRWASADHDRVVWLTAEQLEPGDTDNAGDLYLRVGDGPPIRVTQGELVDGAPTGNDDVSSGWQTDWAASSDDGNRIYFATRDRLTQDAPAGGGLYERDVAEGRTRFVAATGGVPTIRVTPTGVVFVSGAAIDGDVDGKLDVFSWSRGGGVVRLSEARAGAPVSAPADATFVPSNLGGPWEMDAVNPGRSVSADGSRVFFNTAESLVAEDTDGGFVDVYAWTAGEGVALVTPAGSAPQDASYMDSSPDGTLVYFHTRESILPGDIDPNAIDVYRAVLGGGAAPGLPAPEPVPAGPVGPAGALPVVPSTPVPTSGGPKAPEPPAPVTDWPDAGDGDDRGARAERATLELRAAERLGDEGTAVVRATPSVAGELRLVARARVNGKRARRVGSVTEEVGARSVRVRVELSEAALERLEQRGRLRVRFVARLAPSGDERPVRERVTVKLRSGERR